MRRTSIRKSRDLVQKRGEIALAASEAYARKGYRATTMAEIAAELFRGVKEELLASFDAPSPSGTSFAQRLELLLLTQFALIEKRRSAFTVFQAAAMDDSC